MKLAATTQELKRWRDEGSTLPVWWRDDDAVKPTSALEQLISLAQQFDAPLHLAVIPETATPELADRLRSTSDVFVLTHGWRHKNHAPPDQKKAEFGAHRSLAAMTEEIVGGRQRLNDMFGNLSLPVFTPPWNRIAPDVVGSLHRLGFRAISTFLPRAQKLAAEGLLQINTHLDPIVWKSGGGLMDIRLLDAQMAGQLEARRSGTADNAEPYGILTHHLVHDEAIWDFTKILLETMTASGVTRWTSPLHELR